MFDEKNFDELAWEKTGDWFDYHQLVEKHIKELEARSEDLAKEKAEDLFIAQKEEYRLEVIKEINTANIMDKAAEISRSSLYITETVVIDGNELSGSEFILDTFRKGPLYEDVQLIYNEYSREYQLLYRNGKRKFISVFVVVACVIVNATGLGKCRAIVVCLQGVDVPLIFYGGDISPSAIRRQTRFCQKGLKISSEVYCASFIEAIRRCANVFFLTIPEHTGRNLLQGGGYDYTSSLSVIPGLEELYPAEIRQHDLFQHERKFEEVVAECKAKLPTLWKVKLAVTIRVMSLLLSFFEDEGLKSDRIIVFTPRNESEKEKFIAITKRFNYTSTVATSLADRITKVRATLTTGNDVTVIFTYLGGIDNIRSFEKALGEIRMDITGENGIECPTRKVVIILTDVPGSIPEEYPAYYLSFTEEIVNIDTRGLQRLSGELDYSLIQFLINNPDYAIALIHETVTEARTLLVNCEDHKRSGTMTMLIATSILLKKLGLISGTELQAILDWFGKESNSRTNVADTICRKFKEAVNEAILSGALKIAKQVGPPYYSDDGRTAFIAEKDRSINMDSDVIENIIISKLPTRSVTKMNRNIEEKGLLIGKHTKKRKLKVDYGTGVFEDVDLFSYRRSILDAQTKAYVDDIIDNEFWFNVGEYPESFVPVLYNIDGTKAAGYVFKPDMDVNLMEVYFGFTRSGKTYALVNRSLSKVEVEGVNVEIIFDQTGGFTPTEIDKHIGEELTARYFSFWNVYEDGLPIDLLDLRGCTTYKEKKDRITRICAIMSRTIGSYEEQILKNAVKHMLRAMKKNPNITIFDITQYISEDVAEDGSPIMDETHRKLLYKIDAVLDDLSGTSLTKMNWEEFAKAQGKPIIVISTGADGVGKGSEIIDMMLESLYNYNQCHPYEKYTVVIDEVQDLYLHEKGTVNTLLRKSGKHGISMLLASQSFPDPNTPFGRVVGNCGRVRGYRPKANDLKRSADFFGCDIHEVDILQQGKCFDNGLFYSRYRGENVITTLNGRTVTFEPASDNDKDDDHFRTTLR